MELEKNQRRVKSVFDQMECLPKDEEIRSHWTRYMCILTAGMLETSLREILMEYVQRNSDKRVRNRFRKRRQWPLNPKKGTIVSILYDFDKEWGEKIEQYLSGEKGDMINSVMNNRNIIAHGQDVSMTSKNLNVQYQKIVEVIEFINDLVLAQPEVRNDGVQI